MGKRIWMTLIGVWLIGISAGIFSYSNLGMDPYQTFAHGIDIYTPLGFGVTYMIICGLNVLIDLFLDKSKIGLATIINVFFLGYVVEFVETMLGIWVPMPTLAMRILMLLIALLIMCFATALCMTADLGVSCYDVIGMFIADKTNFKFKYVRIVCDIIFVSIGFFLGAKVGIATIITAFFMGPFISFFRVRVTDPMLFKKRNE